ncbi:BTB/POZ domain-containing protein 6-like [Gigantopelta aegis]|uniref:BTB/POZ domain-containing protein 6-like n=1 Tax=Gigantopelta aegis TaxID=1735272 RepID=UPI001B889E0D|nr:BTB/POZ domain-containing protein 6-like [Gigantopelta aegis]
MEEKKIARQTESDFIESWQRGKSLSQSLVYARDHKIMCDVTFKVGEHKKSIEAHKLILCSRSRVFEAMLTGPMAEQGSIVIPEVDPDIFEQFLTFLYTDDVITDGNNVIGLLYVSKKYDVNTLEEKCLTYLETSMTSKNACFILEQAHIYEEEDLKEKALSCIRNNGDASLKSRDVVHLCRGCLSDVIQSDQLIANEETVFESVLSWSESACKSQGREVTPQNRRDALGDAVLHVRYPLMSQKYFFETVSTTELLTALEENKIMKYFWCPGKDVSPFNSNQRNKLTPTGITKQRIIRRLKKVTGRDSWSCPGIYDDGIMFCINTDASLAGLQLYSAHDNTSQTYDIKAFVTKTSTDELVEGSQITQTVVADTKTYDVYFARALQLVKDEKYNLIVNITGPNTHSGVSGRSRVDDGDFICSFFDYKKSRHSSKESNATSVNSGQIPGLLFLV